MDGERMKNKNWYKKFLRLASFRNEVTVISKMISEYIFKRIIEKINNKQIIIDQSLFPNLNKYNVKNIVINIVDSIKDTILVSGEYDETFNIIRIKAEINIAKFDKKSYELLRQRLKYSLRHELEHPHTLRKNPNLDSSIDNSFSEKSIMAFIDYNRKYLINEDEINSFIREFMERAKDKRVLLDDLLDDLIKIELYGNRYEEIKNEILNNTKTGIYIQKVFQEIRQIYIDNINGLYANRKKGKYGK